MELCGRACGLASDEVNGPYRGTLFAKHDAHETDEQHAEDLCIRRIDRSRIDLSSRRPADERKALMAPHRVSSELPQGVDGQATPPASPGNRTGDQHGRDQQLCRTVRTQP